MESKANIIKPGTEESKTFVQKLSEFITKNKVVFLAIVGALVGILVIFGVYTLVASSISNNSLRAMEVARTKIVSWSSEADAAKKTEIENAILGDLDAVIKKWPRTFSAQQALYTKASLYSLKKDWENAEKSNLAAANLLPKTYLAPLALESAAVAAEERGQADLAQTYYQKIVDTYKVDTPNLAHAYFSLGRLAEAKSDWKSALANYDKLLSSFTSSEWSLLAKNRVVYLKAQGLDK